jgi:hypothetical protein
VICESDTTVTFVPGSAPNDTPVAPVNPEPVIVTDVPPLVRPIDGDTEVTDRTTR